jgi:hypothetical protein
MCLVKSLSTIFGSTRMAGNSVLRVASLPIPSLVLQPNIFKAWMYDGAPFHASYIGACVEK